MDFSRFSLNIFLTEVVFFVASFSIAILSTLQINKILVAQTKIASLIANLPEGATLVLPPDLASNQILNTPELITINQFIISFLFATLFFIILTKTKYGGVFFKFIFTLALFAGAQIIFRVWVNPETAIFFAILLITARYVFSRVLIHNIAIIIAICGIATNLGMNIKPGEAIFILIAVSVYDWLAVYVTGHMTEMFKSTISLGTIFAMIVPQNFHDMIKKISEINVEKNKNIAQDKNNLSAYVYLGGGDLAFPLIIAVTALKVGLYSAVVTAIGALVGLLALNIIFAIQKEKKPMAALPPLAAFSILGFLVSLIKF